MLPNTFWLSLWLKFGAYVIGSATKPPVALGRIEMSGQDAAARTFWRYQPECHAHEDWSTLIRRDVLNIDFQRSFLCVAIALYYLLKDARMI